MDTSISGISSLGVQNRYNPIMLGGKVAGNAGLAGEQSSAGLFKGMFQDALKNVDSLDAVKTNDAYNLSVGDMDDLSGLVTNAERAQVAFQLMVQMRNKVLDSYNEVMRMNI